MAAPPAAPAHTAVRIHLPGNEVFHIPSNDNDGSALGSGAGQAAEMVHIPVADSPHHASNTGSSTGRRKFGPTAILAAAAAEKYRPTHRSAQSVQFATRASPPPGAGHAHHLSNGSGYAGVIPPPQNGRQQPWPVQAVPVPPPHMPATPTMHKPQGTSSPSPPPPVHVRQTPVQPFNAPSSPSAPAAPGSVVAPKLTRAGSLNRDHLAADGRLQKMGLPPPILERLASVDPAVLAAQQAAREAAKPDTNKAERFRNLTCPRIRDTTKGTYSLYNVWDFSDRQFLQYGLGVMLWFKLVRRLAWLFLFLFVLNIPSLVVNLAGPDASSVEASAAAFSFATNSSAAAGGGIGADQSLGLSKTTLAHQGLTLDSTILGYSKQKIGLVVGAIDTLSCVIFVIAVLYMFHQHRHESATYNSNVMTVRRFTVLVTDLPHTNPPLNRLAIADFFQKRMGPVVDVSVSYNDMALITLFKQRGEMRREMMQAEAQGLDSLREKLGKKLQALDAQLSFKRRIHKRRVRAAFVTFQHQESVSRALATYPNTKFNRLLMPRHLRFHGVAPRVSRAAEPSNTLFHNLGLSYGDQWCRRAWTGLVSLGLMSVSFVCVFVSQYYQNSIPSTSSCAQSPVTSQAQVTDRDSRFCYCSSLPAGDLYDQSDFCRDYLVQFALAKSLVFVTSASTVLVNFLLQMFMEKLSTLERHSSVTEQQRGITSRLFWGLFFNTGVIILLVNADFGPLIGQTFPILYSLPGKFSDFTPDWFYQVGTSVMFTLFLNSLNPHLLSLMAIPYDRCRRAHCASRQKNQSTLNTLYQGRRFVLFERYSVLLNTVFVCMMFSAGMPILWLVAAFTMGLTYWFDKATFLRSYRIPPRYDESLDHYASGILPAAVVPHLLLALWFFSAPMTNSFQLGSAVPLVPSSESSVGQIRTGSMNLQARLLQWNVFPSVCLLALLFGIFLLRKVLALLFFCRASELERRNRRLGREEKKSKSRAVTYQEACAKMGLESYRLSRQHDYRPAYIVTQSKKQLPAELDLHLLREWEENRLKTRASVAVVQQKAGNDGATQKAMQAHAQNGRPAGPAPAAPGSAAKYAVASPTTASSPSGSPQPGNHAHTRSTPTAAWGAGSGSLPSETHVVPNSASHSSLARGGAGAAGPGPAVSSLQARSGVHPLRISTGHARNQSHGAGSVQSARLELPSGRGAQQQQQQQHAPHSAHPGRTSSPSPPPHSPSEPASARPSISCLQSHLGHNTEQVHQVPTHNLGAAPFAAINHMRDAVLVSMAAAVAAQSSSSSSAEAMGFSLLPISCPGCQNMFQIVDCGEAMSYTCPFCQAATII